MKTTIKKIKLSELNGCLLPRMPLYIKGELNYKFLQGLRNWGNGKLNDRGMVLYDSIKKNGYVPKQHIKVSKNNLILDGHHRVAICGMLYGPSFEIEVERTKYGAISLYALLVASILYIIIFTILKIPFSILKKIIKQFK